MANDLSLDAPTSPELEKLFVNNPALARIEAYLNKFNPIRVMKMERMEIRHSAILAWLLDPRESHGLNDKFLKGFLGEALRGRSVSGQPGAMDVARADLRDTVARREWQNIDVFLHTERNGWAFVIENKFDSKQHEGQLTKYLERVDSALGAEGVKCSGIFLTLNGEEPHDERYASISYETVIQVLCQCIDQNAHMLTNEVRTFLQHYIEILEEEVGMSAERNEIEKLARQLYRENKKVIDFVIRNGGGSEFTVAAEQVFGQNLVQNQTIEINGQRLIFNQLDQRIVSFIPERWHAPLSVVDRAGCEKWWNGYPIIAWLQLWENKDGLSGLVGLYAEVGPLSDYNVRRALIEAIQREAGSVSNCSIKFQQTAANEGKKFSKFLKNNFRAVKDVQDQNLIAEAMIGLLKAFQKEFAVVGAALDEVAALRQPPK